MVIVNQKGNLVIEVDCKSIDPADVWMNYRNTLYHLISEHDNDYTDQTPLFSGIEILRELDLTYEQVKEVLNKK